MFLNWGIICLDSNMIIDSIIAKSGNMIPLNYHLLMVHSANEVKTRKYSGNSINHQVFYNRSIVIFQENWKYILFCGNRKKFWKMMGSQQPNKSVIFYTSGNDFDTWRKNRVIYSFCDLEN